MLAEVTQFRDPVAGKSQLAELLRQVNAGRGFHHSILDWLKSNRLHAPALIFDIEQIEQRMQWLGQLAEPLSVVPLVAVKSCPDPEYLGLGNRHLGGFDVSNQAEYTCIPGSWKAS